ncbi:MAG: helix-turn-helix domain-containing protein [Clostridia bacterium]|nr:helix-turn-helix domain-containing protein [Clostridia bacterium]
MKTDKKYISSISALNKNENLISVSNIYSMFEGKHTPEFYFEGECHNPWEFVYVIDGQVGITADKRVYSLSAGDIIFHKPMEFHKIWSENESRSHVFICSFDLEGKAVHLLRNGIYKLDDEATHIINLLLNMLRKNNKEQFSDNSNMDYADLITQNNKIMQISVNYLELIFTYLSYSDKSVNIAEPNEKINLYTKIVGVLEEHIYDKITISQIADICNVSTATVKNCFAEFAGCGVHKYFLNIKIRKAIELLKSGKNVNEVSDMLQFANPNYFSYVFKRETGTCASSYK